MVPKEWVHPEAREDEVFFSNMGQAEFEKLGFASKRKGKIAYDGEGRPCSEGSQT
jgi:hypothetical protein